MSDLVNTNGVTPKTGLSVPTYDELLTMLEQFELKGGKYINSQKVMTAFALFYAQHGIYVFRAHVPLFNDDGVCVACSCEDFRTSTKCRDEYPHLYLKNGERCENQGKCPMFGGINDSTIDPDEIVKMFSPVRVKNIVTGKVVSVVPNIGIDTGKSNLLGYDDDAYKKANGSTLEDDFAPEEIDTVRVVSGSRKGTHLWFDRENKPYKSKTRSKDGKIADATDVRGVNGYLIAPPSLHKSGNRYEFMDGQALGQVDILPIPKRIDDVLRAAYNTLGSDTKKDSKPDPDAVKRSKELVDGILAQNSIEHTAWEEYPLTDGKGWRLKLKYCPFNDENDPHTDHNVAYIAVHQDGCINAFCPHNRCQKQIEAFGSGWQLFRKIMAKPTSAQSAADKPVGFEQLLDAIEAIRNDASLKPEDRRSKIVKDLAEDIGNIDKAYRIEVAAAVAGANAGFSHTKADQFVKDCASDVKKKRKEAQRAQSAAKSAVQRSNTRPVIEVGDRQLYEIVGDAAQVLQNYNDANPADPATYINGGRVVRVLRDENDAVSITAYSKAGCKLLFSALADYGTTRVNEETGEESFSASFPPDDLVTSFLDMGNWPMCPPLEGVVSAPVFSREGKLHTEPGYNQHTRLYLADNVTLGDTTPTPANISKARSLFMDDLLVDFPFKDEASKAHAVAYTLLPFVRQMVPGQTPITLVNSPTPGTGKTKLIVTCAYPSLGIEVGTMTECEDESEWVKSLTGTFLSGASHLVIDNVNNGLTSGKLASAVTTGVWHERVLGANHKPRLKIKTIFAATGNNVPVTDEIARRCVLIDLDANEERPDKREGFKHSLPLWAKEHRDELVTAAITLVKAWIAKGQPKFTGRAKGSFEEWANVMGGILEVAGIPGFLANDDMLFESAVGKQQALKEFFNAWHDKYGNNEVSARDLFKLASYSDDNEENRRGEWKNMLADYLGEGKQQSRATKFGNLLNTNKNKVLGGHKLVFTRPLHGYKHWRLIDPKGQVEQHVEEVEDGTAPTFPPLVLIEPPSYVGANGSEPEVVTWTL